MTYNKRLKIGILTFQRAHNYGAVLQAYAMRSIFSRYGDTNIIDYWPSYHREQYSDSDTRFLRRNLSIRKRFRLLKPFINKTFLRKKVKERGLKFNHFISEYLLPNNSSTIENGDLIPSNYSVYVYGSDQIWRAFDFMDALNEKVDKYYFGYGIPDEKSRIAYAASSGELAPDVIDSAHIKSLLRRFKAIGVREKDLCDHLSESLSMPVTHVLDPTFLVDKKDWNTLAQQSPYELNKNSNYVLLYNLTRSKNAFWIANATAKKLSLPLVEIKGSISLLDLPRGSAMDTTGPLDFLCLIKNSDFVVASSFHGVVFSIIFNKQFIASGMETTSTRVKSLLSQLGIADRFVKDPKDFDLTKKIDYSKVNEKLAQLIYQSDNFIKEAIFKL